MNTATIQGPGMKPSIRFGSAAVKSVSEADFQAEVLNAKETVIVDFYADWCPPCKRLKPLFEQLANEYQQAGKPVKFVKVNVEDNQNLVQQYGVHNIPTLLIFKGGQQQAKQVGLPSRAYLKALVDHHI